jgi:hypothetical protein
MDNKSGNSDEGKWRRLLIANLVFRFDVCCRIFLQTEFEAKQHVAALG